MALHRTRTPFWLSSGTLLGWFRQVQGSFFDFTAFVHLPLLTLHICTAPASTSLTLQCGFIGHAKDVDFGIFASDFHESIIPALADAGLHLSHRYTLTLTHVYLASVTHHGLFEQIWFQSIYSFRFGHPDDSFELSFKTDAGLKLDIFFFYRDPDYTWNGGTQARTGRKFKYSFTPFELCWTVFQDIPV
jgi:hypothetical protein